MSITSLLTLLPPPLHLDLLHFLSKPKRCIIGTVIVSVHGDGMRGWHKGVIVCLHLRRWRRRCVVILGGGIRRRVSLDVEAVKRFFGLFGLLAPRVMLRVPVMHHLLPVLSLDRGIRPRLRCLHYFPLLLPAPLRNTRSTILRVLPLSLLQGPHHLEYLTHLSCHLLVAGLPSRLDLTDGGGHFGDFFTHLLGLLEDEGVEGVFVDFVGLQCISERGDCVPDIGDLIGKLEDPSPSQIVLLYLIPPHQLIERLQLSLEDSGDLLADFLYFFIQQGDEPAL